MFPQRRPQDLNSVLDAGATGLLAGVLFFLLEMSIRFVHTWSEERPPAGYWFFLMYYALAGFALGIAVLLLRRASERLMRSGRATVGVGVGSCALVLAAVLSVQLWRATRRLELNAQRILLDLATVLLAVTALALIGWALCRLRHRYGSARVLAAHGSISAVLIGAHLSFLHAMNLGQVLARIPDSIAATERANILLLSVDTLRADRLGAYGYRRDVSKNIDRLSAEGTLFRNAIAHSPWTRPSFGSIMTSRYPSQHGAFTVLSTSAETSEANPERPIYDGRLRPETTTMAEILSGHGYTTIAFQTNLRAGRAHGFDRGFQVFIYEALFVPPMQERSLLGALGRWTQLFLGIEPEVFLYGFPPNADKVHGLFESLLPHLPEPFFIWMNFMDPHSPYLSRDQEAPAEGAAITGVYHALNADVSTDALSDAYDHEIRFVDHYIGKTVDLLRDQGLLDNTIVVLTSDHGEEFDDHGVEIRHSSVSIRGRYHGHSLHSELLHVPLIIRFPRQIPQGLRVDGLARQVDILPTILDLVTIEPSDSRQRFEGASLLPLMRGEETGRRLAFSERNLYGPRQSSIQDDRYKLIFENATGRIELYDLDADPGEATDLAAARKQEADRLLALLKEWQANMGTAPPPTPEISWETTEDIERLRSLGYIE